ncbi:TPA: thioredoxin family protein, partial [Clostridium perfringens]
KKKLVPKLKRLKEKNIKFYCFDVSYDKELIKSKYGLEYVPALILYDNSNELKRLIDGIFDSNVLDKYFEYIEVLYES